MTRWRYRITPACAGSTNGSEERLVYNEDHPRLRGEYSSRCQTFQKLPGSPPLARGVPVADIVAACDKRITPACAGSTIKQKMSGFPRQDHPRLRGEYVLDYKYKRGEVGSPPLARGVHLMWYPCLPQVWITPACAGSTINYYPVGVLD